MRRLVYTALIGGHEELWEQPVAAGSEVDFVCFTDDPHLRSDSWRIERVEPVLPLDPARSARSLKIVGHPLVAGYDESLWIDARVVLKADPSAILDAWLASADVAVPRHSYRPSVAAEFAEIMHAGLDDLGRVHEQLNHYALTARDRLEEPVPWTAMLARRHGPAVTRAMAEWMVHVWRYSRRDQLSFVEATARAGLQPDLVPMPNMESELHRWPAPIGRSVRRASWANTESVLAPVVRVGILERELEEAVRTLSAGIERREQQILALEAELAAREEQEAATAEVPRPRGWARRSRDAAEG